MSASQIPTLAELLKQHKCLKLQSNNKIKCKATGHEMSARADVVHAYINGKKFKKDTQWYSFDFSKFLPYIIADKDEKFLRCTLTQQKLNKIPEQIEKHMNGKKFLRLKEEKEQQDKSKKRKSNNNGEEDDAEIWVPPQGLDEEEEVGKPSKIARKASKQVDGAPLHEEEEEDNLSDLMGSDIEEDDEEGSDEGSEEEGDDDEENVAGEDEESEDDKPKLKKHGKWPVGAAESLRPAQIKGKFQPKGKPDARGNTKALKAGAAPVNSGRRVRTIGKTTTPVQAAWKQQHVKKRKEKK